MVQPRPAAVVPARRRSIVILVKAIESITLVTTFLHASPHSSKSRLSWRKLVNEIDIFSSDANQIYLYLTMDYH